MCHSPVNLDRRVKGLRVRHLLLPAGAFAVLLASSIPSLADVSCVQSTLARLGYDAGPVDGALGRRTQLAAESFAADAGIDLPGLAADNSAQWCEALRGKAQDLPRFDIASRPGGVLSQGDTERLWSAYKRAKVCFDHPIYGEGERLKIRRHPAKELMGRAWTNPFTPVVSKAGGQRKLPALKLGKPVVAVRLDERYGERIADVDSARTRFSNLTSRVRNGVPESGPALRKALLDWARAGALSKGINVSWGHKPVDWQMMTAIMSFATATGAVAETLTEEEKSVIGPWLNRLVAESANSRWKDRQDNKAYLRTYMTMLWGLTIGDDQAVQKAIDTFKLAIHDMRPDGSMPIDTQRSGMGLKYNSDSVSYLVMMAALLRANTGQDLFAYEVDGRSLHDAVDFVVKSIQSPRETNRLYAISCPDGGDRWGSVESPSMSFAGDATYLLVYASLFPGHPNASWIKDKYGNGIGLPAETFGGAPTLLFDFAGVGGE